MEIYGADPAGARDSSLLMQIISPIIMSSNESLQASKDQVLAAIRSAEENGDRSILTDFLVKNPEMFRPTHYQESNKVIFGWVENGDGVWVLKVSSPAVEERLQEIAKAQPDLSHNMLLAAAGATFYNHWSESSDARQVKEKQVEEEKGEVQEK